MDVKWGAQHIGINIYAIHLTHFIRIQCGIFNTVEMQHAHNIHDCRIFRFVNWCKVLANITWSLLI